MRPTLRNHFILAMSLALIFFMSLLAALAASAPGDEHWDPQFGPAGANNNLYAVSVSGNKVYVGGYLTGLNAYQSRKAAQTNPYPDAYRRAESIRVMSRWQHDLSDSLQLSVTPYVRFTEMDSAARVF